MIGLQSAPMAWDTVTIRCAGGEDLPRTTALLEELADWHIRLEPDHHRGFVSPDPEQRLSRLAALVADPSKGVALIADDAHGEALGLAIVHVQPSGPTPLRQGASTGTFLIENIVVAAGQRRRGIGRALMAAAQSWAAERGAKQVVLTVRESNVPALRFYQALGCRTVSRWLAIPLARSG
jgi:ribosomal protein S18 acetylase RimI-like enzyme